MLLRRPRAVAPLMLGLGELKGRASRTTDRAQNPSSPSHLAQALANEVPWQGHSSRRAENSRWGDSTAQAIPGQSGCLRWRLKSMGKQAIATMAAELARTALQPPAAARDGCIGNGDSEPQALAIQRARRGSPSGRGQSKMEFQFSPACSAAQPVGRSCQCCRGLRFQATDLVGMDRDRSREEAIKKLNDNPLPGRGGGRDRS